MIDFERLFEQSKCKLEKQLENKVIDTKILPHLQCQGKDVVVDDLVKTNKSCFLIGDGGSGKTSTLLLYWSNLCKRDLNISKMIPLYIRVSDLVNKEKYPHQTLIEYIKWNYEEMKTVLNPYAERSNFIKSITNNISDYKVILLIDAIDELWDKEARVKLWDEIECFMGNESIYLMITSRIHEKNIPASIVSVQVEPLWKEQIISFLQSKGITRLDGLNISQLFFNPMFLTLYVNAYDINWEKLSSSGTLTEVELLEDFFTAQLKRHNDDKLVFVLQLLLPIMCYLLFVNNERLENVSHVRSIMEQALQICFNDIFLSSFISYDLEDNRIAFQKNNIEEWLLDFTIICTKIMNILYLDNDYYNWQHASFSDWFTCRGIILAIKKEIIKEEDIFQIAVKKIESDNSLDKRLESLKVCEYLYKERAYISHCTKEYVVFLVKLTYLYDTLRKDKEACILSKDTLNYLNSENVKDMFNDKVELARYINGVAYALVHLHDFDVSTLIELNMYAKKQFDMALKLIENDNSSDALKVKACIYGNIGAYFITTHKLSIIMAKENHDKALAIREVLAKEYYEDEVQESKATSYTCLATDYFLIGKYDESVKYHQKAIEFRRKENKKAINFNRAAGAMIYDILLHPQNSHYNINEVLEYLYISLELIESEGEYGELRSWKETFFSSINLLPLVNQAEREQFKSQMEELIKKYEIIYSSMYIYVEDYVKQFHTKINDLKI